MAGRGLETLRHPPHAVDGDLLLPGVTEVDTARFGGLSGLTIPVVLLGLFLAFALGGEILLRRQGYRPRARPPRSNVPHSFEESSSTLTGGARIRGMNTSVPSATLTIDSDWARLSVGGLRQVWIRRSDVLGVRRICTLLPPGRYGIMFDTEDGELDGLIFWSLNPTSAVATLRRFGWPA